MDRKTGIRTVVPIALALCLGAALPVAAAELAEVSVGESTVVFTPKTSGDYVLRVSGPGDFYSTRSFRGAPPSFSVFTQDDGVVPDGAYVYELWMAPLQPRVRKQAPATQGRQVQHGSFGVRDGAFVVPEFGEAEVPAKPMAIPTKDIVHLDDVIIDGSLCVGNDCYQDYDFGYDTIVLRENNLRIYFEDTSTIAGYPTNDWRITVNDHTSGGADRFSIEDATEVSTPFTIEAGTPNHSLYVEDMGRIGLGTSTPYVELHVVDGDSPTLRLEQDGSFGFTPQTWDITSNETNFFIRDATGGSRLPFRIQPGSPTSSLTIRDSGYVGVGTWAPNANLHVQEDSAGAQTLLELRNNGRPRIVLEDSSVGGINEDWMFGIIGGGSFGINALGDATAELELQTDGDLIITGSYTPDYVFAPDYPLMPLAELQEFIAENRHLPNVPSNDEVATTRKINLNEFQMRLLEKIEELTLYTLGQQQIIDAQQQVNDAQQQTIEELKASLEALAQR